MKATQLAAARATRGAAGPGSLRRRATSWKPRERVDGHGVGVDAAHVAERRRRSRSSRAQTAVAQPRQVGAGDRALDREGDRARRRAIRRPSSAETHRTDEFRGTPRSNSSTAMHEEAHEMTHGKPHPLARAARPLPGRPDDRARRHDRRRRAAVDPGGSRLLARRRSRGSSTPTCSRSAASCCSAAGSATSSATGGCS